MVSLQAYRKRLLTCGKSWQSCRHVQAVTGLGLMVGIQLDADKKAIDVVNAALEQGLLLLTAKDRVRLLPPLTISKDELDRGVAILADVLSK